MRTVAYRYSHGMDEPRNPIAFWEAELERRIKVLHIAEEAVKSATKMLNKLDPARAAARQ